MKRPKLSIFGHAFSALLLLSVSNSAKSAVYFERACPTNSSVETCSQGGKVTAIYIYDKIDYHTESELLRFDKELPTSHGFPKVFLNSTGGNIYSAISIGRVLRRRNAEVWNRDYFEPEKIPICASACVLVALGAVRRNLLLVGLHKASEVRRIKGETYERLEVNSKQNDIFSEYYKSMSIRTDFEKIISKIPYGQTKYIIMKPNKKLRSSELFKLELRMDPLSNDEKRLLNKKKYNYTDFVKNLKSASARGDSYAAFEIGKSYLYGLRNVDKDSGLALAWFEITGALGNLVGYHFLGVLYTNGHENIDQDHEKAFKFTSLAAFNGFTASQNNLAWAYYKGQGIPKDLNKALYWATKAVEGGDPFSYGTLGTIMLSIDSFADDKPEIYKWLKMAANGLPDGTAKDEDNKRLASLIAIMTPQEIAEGDRRIKLWKPSRDTGARMRDPEDK